MSDPEQQPAAESTDLRMARGLGTIALISSATAVGPILARDYEAASYALSVAAAGFVLAGFAVWEHFHPNG